MLQTGLTGRCCTSHMNKCLGNLHKPTCKIEAWKILATITSILKSHYKSCFYFSSEPPWFCLSADVLAGSVLLGETSSLQVFSLSPLWVPQHHSKEDKLQGTNAFVLIRSLSVIVLGSFHLKIIFHIISVVLASPLCHPHTSFCSLSCAVLLLFGVHCFLSFHSFKSLPTVTVEFWPTSACAEGSVQFLKGITTEEWQWILGDIWVV